MFEVFVELGVWEGLAVDLPVLCVVRVEWKGTEGADVERGGEVRERGRERMGEGEGEEWGRDARRAGHQC